jgi:hypothetical protein
MLGVSPAIIGLLRQMGTYLQSAIRQAAVDYGRDKRVDPDALAEWLLTEMSEWEPKMKGRNLADPETRRAAARLLAGIACNLISPENSNVRAA